MSASAGTPVILDATHARRPWRLAITQVLSLPAPVEWIGWWLDTPLATCLQWNQTRQRLVPTHGRELEALPHVKPHQLLVLRPRGLTQDISGSCPVSDRWLTDERAGRASWTSPRARPCCASCSTFSGSCSAAL